MPSLTFHPLSKRVSIRTIDGREVGCIVYSARSVGWHYRMFDGKSSTGAVHPTWTDARDELLSQPYPVR